MVADKKVLDRCAVVQLTAMLHRSRGCLSGLLAGGPLVTVWQMGYVLQDSWVGATIVDTCRPVPLLLIQITCCCVAYGHSKCAHARLPVSTPQRRALSRPLV